MNSPATISGKDRLIIALLTFFLVIAFSLELYWVLLNDELVARADHELFAYLFKIYGDADRGYFDRISPTAVGLEQINVFISQVANAWLLWAIVQRRYYRHILQLTLGSYLAYSVVLYFWAAHASGYPDMRYASPYTYFLFYAPNLPWLLGYGYMACDSIRALASHLRAAPGDASA